jgi:tetratricopeptide (TPR) repeat protein
VTVEVYLGERFKQPHERRALGRFLTGMVDAFETTDRLYMVVVEPLLNNAEMDLVLVSPTAIVVIEFKELTHAEESERQQIRLVGKENDPWQYRLPDGRIITLGDPAKRKNPYRQVRQMRYHLAQWCEEHAEALPAELRSKADALKHTSAWVVLTPGFDGDLSELDLPWDDTEFDHIPGRWFQVFSIENLAHEFDCATDTRLQLTESQIRGLIAQMGVQPCPNLRELIPNYVSPAPIFSSRAPSLDTLIDREAQRADLLRALEDRYASTMVVQGLGGVGKTALAAWLVDQATRRNVRVRWLDCREKTDLTLDSLLTAVSAEMTDLRRALIRDPNRPASDRMDAALDFLNRRPTLLVFDDYHLLANRASINPFIGRAARYRDGIRILLTSRERVTDPAWPFDAVQEIEIEGLTFEDFAQLVSADARHLALKANDLKTIWQRFAGNPQMFMLSKPLIRQYALMSRLSELPIPESDAWLDSLFDTLSTEARGLAQRLSVIRTRLTFALIVGVSKMEPSVASRLTLELVDKYLLQQASPDTFTIAEFIRLLLGNRMPEKLRKEAHQKTADYYAELAAGMQDELKRIELLVEAIHHCESSGSRKPLLRHAADVYDLLLKAGDRDRAQAIAETACAAARAEHDEERTCSWLLKVAGLELYRERRDTTENLLDQAVKSLPALGKKATVEQRRRRQKLEAQIWILRGRTAYYGAEYALAVDHFKKALPITREVGDKQAEATCLAWLGRVARQRKEYDHAIERFRAALALAEQLSDHKLTCDGLSHLGLVARSQKNFAEARDLFRRAREVAAAARDPQAEEITLGHLARTEMLSGNYVEAERVFRDCLALATELHNSRGMRVQLVNLVEVLIRLERYDDAEVIVQESEQRNAEAGDAVGQAWNLKHRGQVAKARGQAAVGNQLIQQGIDMLERIGNREYLDEFQAALRDQNQLPLN